MVVVGADVSGVVAGVVDGSLDAGSVVDGSVVGGCVVAGALPEAGVVVGDFVVVGVGDFVVVVVAPASGFWSVNCNSVLMKYAGALGFASATTTAQ